MHRDNPLLILAGAGSGKTRVITVKIAYQIEELQVDPHRILAVTFTNKAANEMRERAVAINPATQKSRIKTFHSFGAYLLRKYGNVIGLKQDFGIYDTDDSIALLKTLYPDQTRSELGKLVSIISRAKDMGIAVDDDFTSLQSTIRSYKNERLIRTIYTNYQERLQAIGNVDFGDLLLKSIQLLRSDADLLTRIQNSIDTILVDEYQDSNSAQFQLLSLLKGEKTYICVVGDDDQSIYRFRGADVHNILSFPDRFPRTDIIRLEQNYRSTGNIIALASSIINRNRGRLGKKLWTESSRGAMPQFALLGDEQMEAIYCANIIAKETSLQTAILYRTNAQSRAFEHALLSANIPYRIFGGLRFYDREEIKNSIALMRFILNPKDEIGFRRIVNRPSRGIGAVTIANALNLLPDYENDILEACRQLAKLGNTRVQKSLASFIAMIEKARQEIECPSDETLPLGQFIERQVKISGLWESYQSMDPVVANQKMQNLEELINAATLFETNLSGLSQFLETVELDSSINSESGGNNVTLITIHNTKGLEFDRVIITGLEENLFPNIWNEQENERLAQLEEERRLFYVATTRARKELFLTSCLRRSLHGRITRNKLSRFVEEIPPGMIQKASHYFLQQDIPSNDRTNYQASNSPSNDTPLYPVGTRVKHYEYGVGAIVKNWHNGRYFVVLAQFEDGRNARFIERYANLSIIESDE